MTEKIVTDVLVVGEYRDSVLPPNVKVRVAVEQASTAKGSRKPLIK
jgi:hypothetical protein